MRNLHHHEKNAEKKVADIAGRSFRAITMTGIMMMKIMHGWRF